MSATTRTAPRWGDAGDLTLPRDARRTKVDGLRDLRRLLAATFPVQSEALEWLRCEVPLVERHRPINLIRRGDLESVIRVLAGVHSGAFA